MDRIQIEETVQNRDYWITRPYLSEAVRQSLAQSNVLLVPQEGFRGQDVQVFPVCTEDFFSHLKEELSSDFAVEIAIDDTEYREAALHSALLILGSIVVGGVTLVVIPVIVNVVSEYINRRLYNEKDREETRVRWELTVVDGPRATKLTYEGPAVDLSSKMAQAIEQLSATIPPSSTPLMIQQRSNDENSG
jgi:hypothetical protein